MKMACLGEELFTWFVDTLNNVKGRLRSALLLQKAQQIAKDLVGIHQQRVEAGVVPPHGKLNLPVINYVWLRRWRRTYGVSARMANLRFKAPKSVILHRLQVFWCNMIRVRALHALLEPEGELVMQGFDQKPLWFTASSQEKTMALRGSRKVVVKENMPMTRARFTAMTRCAWPAPPTDGKEIAILFKAKGGGERIRETLRVHPGVLLQFQERGSYRLPDVLAYIAWILDHSRTNLVTASSQGQGPSGSSQGKHQASASSCVGSADAVPPALASTSASSQGNGQASASSCVGSGHAVPPPLASTSASSQGKGRVKPGRRVIYLLD